MEDTTAVAIVGIVAVTGLSLATFQYLYRNQQTVTPKQVEEVGV